MLINVFLVLSSFFIVYLDIKYRKIFNITAYPLMASAIAINIYIFGLAGIFYSLVGFTAGLLAWYIAYKLNFSGYGEFKLLALVGILKGYYFVLSAGFISCFLISLSHILNLILSGDIKLIIQNRRVYLDLVLEYGISISTIIEEHIQKLIVPYSAVVLIAIMIMIGIGS